MTSPKVLASFDHDTSCSRTSLDCSLLTMGTLWPLSFTDFPYWGGMNTDGELFEHRMPAHLISVRDGSVSLPTPRTSDTNGVGVHGDGGMDLRTAISVLPTPRASMAKGPSLKDIEIERSGRTRSTLDVTVAAFLPTPTGRDHKGRNQRNDETCLPGAVLALRLKDGSESSDGQLLTQLTPGGSPADSLNG